jgi:hypothetical protein
MQSFTRTWHKCVERDAAAEQYKSISLTKSQIEVDLSCIEKQDS